MAGFLTGQFLYKKWRCALFLGALGAVERAALVALGNAGSIQRAADDVVTDTGQIAHTAAADQHDGVLLQIVANARNVASTFDGIGQADSRNFTQSRIRLLGRGGFHAQAHAALLRATLQDGRG